MRKLLQVGVLLILCVFLIPGCITKAMDEGKTNLGNSIEPITLVFYNSDPQEGYDNFEDPIAKAITKETGVTLDLVSPGGENKQKISIMIASGDYPDLFYAREDQSMLINERALIDLTSLIDKNGENLKKLYGPYINRLRYSLEDKSIYQVGSYGVNDQYIEPISGFQLQHAVVKELGYPELRTLEDYENAIRLYKEKHPTIDGQPTIGMSVCADGWRIRISVTNPASFATGQNGDDGEWYIDQNTNKAVFHLSRPEEKEYFRWLNHMYNSGLLDPESFVQKYEQYSAKIASGRVLGLSDANWEFSLPQSILKSEGKYDRMYGTYPITLSEKYINKAYMTGGYDGGWGIGITISCKNPQRAIEFLDWMASDEGQILCNWGIEGVNYQVVDGKRTIADEEWGKWQKLDYMKATGVRLYTYPFPQYGRMVKDSTGQYYNPETPERIVGQYTEIEKEVLAEYGVTMWRDLYEHDFEDKKYGFAYLINLPGNSEVEALFQTMEEISWRRITEAVMSAPGSFDSIWDSYQQEMIDAGLHKMEDEFNKLLADRIQLWSEEK